MNKLIAGLMILGSINAYADEVPLRLTSKNISTITSLLVKECTPRVDNNRYQTATYKVLIKLTDGKTVKVLFNAEELLETCGHTQAIVANHGRVLVKKLSNIQNADLSATRVGDNLVCLQDVGNIVYDTETSTGTSFEEKAVVVKCP